MEIRNKGGVVGQGKGRRSDGKNEEEDPFHVPSRQPVPAAAAYSVYNQHPR